MKGLKVIPLFVAFMIASYLGMRFVEANREPVTISFFDYQSEPTPIGLVVLTSALIGMIFCGALCTIELFALYVKNRNLKRRIILLQSQGAGTGPKPKAIPDKTEQLAAAGPTETH